MALPAAGTLIAVSNGYVRFIDPATGATIDTFNPPALSAGDSIVRGGIVQLPTGEVMVCHANPVTAYFYSAADFATLVTSDASVAFSSSLGVPGAANSTTKFYVNTSSGVRRFAADGTADTSFTTSVGGVDRDCIGVDMNDTFVIQTEGSEDRIWKNVLGGASSVVADESATFDFNNCLDPGAGLVLQDDAFFIPWYFTGPGPSYTVTFGFRIYESDGTERVKVITGPSADFFVCAARGADASYFWIALYIDASDTIEITKRDASDGSVLAGPFSYAGAAAGGAGTFDYDNMAFVEMVGASSDPAVCHGGGEITVVADPPVGEDFSGRSLSPRAWLTLAFDDEDRSLAIDRYNHPDGPKLGMVSSYGAVSRQLGTRLSPYRMAEFSVEVADDNRLLSTLEAAAASMHWQNREGTFYVASPATIAAAGTPHVRFRGIWTGHTSTGFRRSLQFSSVLGSEMSDLNLSKLFPLKKIGALFPSATDETKAKVIPLAMGKWKDTVGQSGDPVTGVVATAVPSTLAAPTGVTATFGSGGALFDPNDFRNIGSGVTLYYAISAVVLGIESLPAYVSVTSTEADGHVDLGWDAYASATAIRVSVSYRSDFLQYATLTTDIDGAETSLTDATGGTRTDVNVLSIWSMGLRMNVDYLCWAKLAGGGLSTVGRTSSPGVMFTPVTFARDRTAAVTWDAYPDAIGYVVVRLRSYYSNWGQEYDKRWDLGAGTTTLTDVMTSEVVAVDLPGVPTGTLPLIDVNYRRTIDGKVCRGLLLCKGGVQHIEDIYLSRALIGVGSYSKTDEKTFELVPETAYGDTWYAPGKPGYPDAENYYAIGDDWVSMVWTTVEPLPVSIRVNACTRTDQPEGTTGSVITGAPRGFFHLLNQEVLPPVDEVWRSGDYLAPRTFTNGTPIVNSASFAAAEAIEVVRMAPASTTAEPYADGYQWQLYLDTPISLRELIDRVTSNFALQCGENEQGQFMVAHLNEFVDLSTCRLVTDAREIQRDTNIDRRLAELENTVVYDWGWRPADNTFDSPGADKPSAEAITANRGRAVSGERIPFTLTRDPATIASVTGFWLTWGKYPPNYATMRGPLHWINGTNGIKLGQVVRVTDCEGTGPTGYVDQPMFVLGMQELYNSLDEPIAIELQCVDVLRFLSSFGVLAPDAVPAWASATDLERSTYLFFASDAGLMPDGSVGKGVH